jgi:hypothetical protein
MRKIADADELEIELRRLLAYAQTDKPSRSRLASELESLRARVAGEHTRLAAELTDEGRMVASIEGPIEQVKRVARGLMGSRGLSADTKIAVRKFATVVTELDDVFGKLIWLITADTGN